jgi:hypothetical protein
VNHIDHVRQSHPCMHHVFYWGHGFLTCFLLRAPDVEPRRYCGQGHTLQPCSLDLSTTSYFSLRTNQPPAISQQYFSLKTNQHQPSATSQTNRPYASNLQVGQRFSYTFFSPAARGSYWFLLTLTLLLQSWFLDTCVTIKNIFLLLWFFRYVCAACTFC